MACSEAAENGGPDSTKPEQDTVTIESEPATAVEKKWAGWPGHSVFRVIVPVLKVGSIIGRKGELVKKLCEDTKTRIRVLDGPPSSTDRIVLVSGKEEPEAPVSPAMRAVIRIFKRVSGLPESKGDDDKAAGASAVAFCAVRLLVSSTQAISLIGKQGSSIKSIQSTGASVRVLSTDEAPMWANSEERVVEIQGEALKVLAALEAVVGHLRKFLVDQSVLPLFEKSYNAPAPQERKVETWADKPLMHSAPQTGIDRDYTHSLKRESLYLDRETHMETQRPSSGFSMYGQDPGLSGIHSSGFGRAGGPIITQIAQTMQIPLEYAEDIIGIGGTNVAYIRRTSGAVLTVQESRGIPDEITVEIKGTSSQVQAAQQLIQECVNNHKEVPRSYGNIDSGLRSSYSQLGNDTSSYPTSSFSGQQYGGGYGSSTGVGGGYTSSFRM